MKLIWEMWESGDNNNNSNSNSNNFECSSSLSLLDLTFNFGDDHGIVDGTNRSPEVVATTSSTTSAQNENDLGDFFLQTAPYDPHHLHHSVASNMTGGGDVEQTFQFMSMHADSVSTNSCVQMVTTPSFEQQQQQATNNETFLEQQANVFSTSSNYQISNTPNTFPIHGNLNPQNP